MDVVAPRGLSKDELENIVLRHIMASNMEQPFLPMEDAHRDIRALLRHISSLEVTLQNIRKALDDV